MANLLEMPMFTFGVIAATNPERKSGNSHFITSVNLIVSMKSGEFTLGYSYDLILLELDEPKVYMNLL